MPSVAQVIHAFDLEQLPIQLIGTRLPTHEVKRPASVGHGHDYIYPDLVLTFRQAGVPNKVQGRLLQALSRPRSIDYRGWDYQCSFVHPVIVENTATTLTVTGTAVCKYRGPSVLSDHEQLQSDLQTFKTTTNGGIGIYEKDSQRSNR